MIVTGSNPIKVTPQLDAAHAATQQVGSAGGAINVTGADGSKYTLTIPSGALAGNVQITMTPISSLGGKPIGDVFGVKLAPDGLLLAKVATLDVTPARSIPFAQQVGWGYNGDGKDFHLVPLADQASLRIGVSHFSADGAGSATAAQQQAVTSQPPSTPQASYEQLRAQVIEEIRVARQNGTSIDPSFTDKLQRLADAYYDQVIAPALGHAADSPTQLYDTFSKFNDWQRQLDLLGVTLEPRRSQAIPVLEAAFNKVLAQLVTQCGGGVHGLRLLVTVTAARQGVLVGFVSETDARDAIEKCSNVKLHTVLDAATGFNASCASNSCSSFDIQSDSSHLVVTDDLLTTKFDGLGDNVYAFGSSAAGSPATFPSFSAHAAPSFDISECDQSAKPAGTLMLIVVVVVDSEFLDPRVTQPTLYIVAGAYPKNTDIGAAAGLGNLVWTLRCSSSKGQYDLPEWLYDDAALATVTAPDGIPATHAALTNPPLPNVVLRPTGAPDTYSGVFSGSGDITNWAGLCTGYCQSVVGTVSSGTFTISPG